MMGQTIPKTWRSGVHYVHSKSSSFSTGEAVVVTRSNGSKNFGVVIGLKVHLNRENWGVSSVAAF